MRVIADTNVLVRAVVRDDKAQARLADKALREAEIIAVTSTTLCEFAWVLRRTYRFGAPDIAAAIRALLDAENVVADRSAAEAGMALMEAGGDFADAIVAQEGAWLGGETFVSFDRQAVELLAAQGRPARLLR